MITKILISIGLIVLIVKLVSFFQNQAFPSQKEIEELRGRIKAEVEKETGNAEKAERLAEREVKKLISSQMNFGFWLPMFFSVMPLMVFLFYIIARIIQSFVIGTGKYIIVEPWAPFGIPVGFLALSFGGLFLEIFIGKRFVLKKLGKEIGEKCYQAATGLNSRVYKEAMIFLLITGVISLILTSFCIYDYAKIDEEGIYLNQWPSYEERFYSWDMISGIYYDPHNTPSYVFVMNDGRKWDTSPYEPPLIEVNGKKDEAINFILSRSNVSVEKLGTFLNFLTH